jgi:FKBP-type peptidyl-prolyl cis-trans isomerase SlyD
MKIEADKVVLFHYELSAADSAYSESSRDGEPVACLVGHDNILPAVESALLGREPGDELALTLQPGEGYGERRPNAIQRVPIKHLIGKKKLQAGMVVKVNTADGPRDATVIKVGKFNVDLDTNHPLAGKVLNFLISVVAVRDGTPEEVAHGHAHGAGGHHHH